MPMGRPALRWLALVAAAAAAPNGAALLGLVAAVRARTWSAAPLLETSTRQATTWVFGENRWDDESVWTDVDGLAVSIKTSKHFVLLSYQVGLEASYDADGELFMWEKFDPLTGGTVTQRRVGAGSFVESGRIQMRFIVDGVPLREGSAHVSATLTSKGRSKLEHIEGTAVLQPGNATRDIKVQWKPSGKLVWSSSPSTGDGFMSGRVLAATAHDTMYASSPLTPAAITQKDWFPVEQSSLNISLNETTAVRFGYALTVSAAAPGPQMLASPLTADDYVQARLVVDNTPSDESVATLGTKERAASVAGVLARDVVLDLPKGAHNVRLEWRRAGNSPRMWRNDPNCLDGFGSSRLLYASLSDYGVYATKHAQVLAGMQYKRKTAKSITDIRAKSKNEWATVESDTFVVEQDAQVLLRYALPVALHKLSNWDAWTFDQLQAVQARLLVDGVIYREDSSSVGGFQSSGLHDDLRGALALPLLAGTHSCTLQWKSVGDETWYLASKHLGGTGKGVIDVIVDFRQQASLQVVHQSFSVKEDTSVNLKGISVQGVSFVDNYDVSLEVHASSGDVSLHNFTGPTKEANLLLKELTYTPCAECWGRDEVQLELVTEEGTVFNATLSIEIEPVDDVPELEAPDLLEVESRVSLRGISVSDVDSEDEAYKLTLFALGGVFEGCRNATATSVLEYEMTLDAMNLCLQESYYRPLEGFAEAFVDNVTLTLEDPGPSKHRLTEHIQIHAAVAQSGPRIELPPYYELGLEGFIVEGDDANTTVSLTTDALDALLRLDSLEQGVSIDQTEHGIILRGSAKAISTTLQSLTYVREPSFEGSDTITAVIRTSNASRTAKVAIDVRGGDATELSLVDLKPRRGFGGTRVRVTVLHADEFPLQCQFGERGAAKARKVDNETFECVAPQGRAGYASLRVHNRRFWSDPIQFLYEEPVRVVRITPPVGSVNTPLLLHVDSVMPSPDLACHFGDVIVKATRLDSTTVACTAPDLNGTVEVAVSTNGVDHGPSSLFEFVDVPSSLTLEPASGGLAPQLIRVTTDVPLKRLPHFCRFGLYETPAAVLDDYTLACEAPRSTENQAVRVSIDGGASYGEAFAIYRRVDSAIAWIAPAMGSHGTLVTIGGRGFDASTTCRFGSTEVEAAVVSAEELVCRAPVGNGTVAIGLLVDEVEISSRHSYTYVEPTLLGSLSPNTGPTTGGTLVTIHGLRLADDASCNFGNASVPARWVSAEQIECAAPPHKEGVVDVTVAGEVLRFQYAAPLVPRAAYPSSGPAGGGTVVAIEGSGFAFSPRLKCRFGWTEVPATFVSEAEVRCAAPPGDAGPRALAVSGNGQDFVDVPAGFAYEAAPVVHGVAPPLGFAGTLVTLTGAGLGGVSACLFGDASTPATVVSDTEVRCAAPAGAGSLAVGASVNGVDAYASAARFRYVARPEVLSLEPASAGVEGGATVVVRGLRFPDSSLLACRFGATTAAARWVNATELECEAPPADASGPVTVEVSANGADFTADGAAFSYAATATVTGAGPLSGPATGGTEVVVRGAKLVFSPSLACRFAFFDVPASFVGPTELRCAAPAQSAGAAAFAVVDDRRVLYEATFEYTPLMAVRGASPPRGAAGTSVTVAGSGFAAYATAECVFGDIRVEAVVTSDTEVTCEAPPGEGDVTVRVVSGATTAAGEAIFTYARAPSVSNLRPSTAAAGEPVTVYGADFVDASELACVFGDATTQARYVSSTELVCVAPVNEGVVDVAVTVNGVAFGASAATFTYAATNATYELRPRRLATKGGTIVQVRGPHLELAPSLACRFGVYEVLASVKEGALACRAPPLEVGSVAFRVMSDGRVVYDTQLDVASIPFEASPTLGANGTLVHVDAEKAPYRQCCVFGDHIVSIEDDICRAPPGRGRVVLRVAPCDAPDSEQDGLSWTYVQTPILYAVAPSVLSPSLDGSASVIGAHFVDAVELTCYANSVKVPARFVSESEIVCDLSEEEGPSVSLSISVNGQDRSNALKVEIAPQFIIHDATPSTIRPSTKFIEVRGAGFIDSRAHALVCVTGDHVTAARHVSASVVRCPVVGLQTSIKLCYEGLGCSNALALSRKDAPVIDSVEPAVLSVEGGAVKFYGSGFMEDASCQFGDVTVVALTHEDDLVECVMPAMAPGAYASRVVFEDVSSSPETLRVVAKPAVASIKPAIVGLTGGMVTVQGGAFPADLEVVCAFDGTISQGRRLSSTSVSCAAPPTGLADTVQVRVGFSPHTLSATSTSLNYAPAGRVVDVAPTVVASGQATELTLIGTNLRDVACRFDGVVVEAQVIDANEARCAVTGRTAKATVLEVSLDGALYEEVESISVVDRFALSSAEVLGDELVVRGSFTDSITSCIFDGRDFVDATVHNASTITCPATTATSVQVGNRREALSESMRIDTIKQFVIAKIAVVDRGATLRLGGANLVEREHLACDFGALQTSVTKQGSHLECALPDAVAQKGGGFELINAGRPPIYLVEPLIPKQAPRPTVFDVVRVDASLRVRGANFIREDVVECLVRHTTLIGTHVSPRERACLDVVDDDLSEGVTIRLNGVEVLTTPVASSESIEEDTPIGFRTLSVRPSLVSADQGGILTVAGVNYPLERKLFCRIDDLVVEGEALNTTAVLCRIPQLDRIGTFNLTIEGDAGGTSIRVLRDPSIAQVTPTAIARGDVVRVEGANFVEGATFCKFDSHIVPAAFVNTRSISCVAPSSASTLRVSNDGRAFSSHVNLTAKRALVFGAVVSERRVSVKDTTFSVEADNVTCAPRCTCSDNVCRTSEDRVCVIIDGVKSAQMCGSLQNIPIVSAPPNADRASPSVVHGPTDVVVRGGAFALHHQCLVNGSAVATTWLSPTQLSCLIDAAPGSYDLSVNGGVSTRIEVTSRVLVETLSDVTHVDDVVEASLSNTIDVGGASCTFDGHTHSADVVDGTHVYCHAPSEETRADVSLSVGALPLHGSREVSIKEPPRIHSVEPPLAPVGISTEITVRGNFPSQKLYCRFGSVNTEASVLSASELRCPVPPTDTVRTVPFDVGYSRGQATHMAHAFAFYRQARLASVKPRSASIGSSISVQIAAPDNLRYPAFASCKFGDRIVEAARPSSSEFVCQVPPLQPGAYELAVALDGSTFSQSMPFYVVEAPSVLKVEPSSASVRGGAFIEVSGTVGSLLHTACVFDGVVSRALSETNGSVTCVAPRVQAPQTIQVRLAVHGLVSETSAPFTYVRPLYLQSVTPVRAPPRALIHLEVDHAVDGKCLFGDVETAFNGLECAVPSIQGVVDLRVKTGSDVSNAIHFEILEAVSLESVLPHTGPTTGNTALVIRGTGFARHHAVECRWRRDGALSRTNATVSTDVRCLTPAFAQGPGVYDLSLTVDGVESESLFFEVRDTLELLDMDLDVSTALGGASTLIRVRHLELPTSDAECRFGGATVPATYWAANVVQCRVPAHAAGKVNVSVSPDGVHFYGNLQIVYVPEPPSIIEIVPSTIYDSNASIALVGSGFTRSKRLTCRFTGDEVTETPASYTGEGATCQVPSSSSLVQASVDGIHWGPGVRLIVSKPPVVSMMGPEGGPESGSTIYLEGVNLAEAATESAKCRVGSTEVDADINEDGVACRVPAMAPGTVPVLILPNGRDVIHTSSYTVKPRPALLRAEPMIGTMTGGHLITVHGSRLASLKSARCSFSGVLSAAEVINGGLRCVQPPLDEGTYSLTIDSALGLLEPVLRYEVLSSVRVDSLAPSYGYASTIVEVAGRFSDLEAPLTCLFGSNEANASLVSDTLLKCTAPESSPKRVSLRIRDARGRLSEGKTYHYLSPIQIHAVARGEAVEAGKDGALTITGLGFPDTPQLACRVDDMLYDATWMASHLLVCAMPPLAAQQTNYTVFVTSNGVDFVPYQGIIEAAGMGPIMQEDTVEDAEDPVQETGVVVLAVAPPSAPASGGHSVKIHLSAPLQGVVACRFGAITRPARFISDDVATCATPSLSGDVLFSFEEDDTVIPFANSDDMLFTLRGRSHAMRLSPSQGDEGTLVEIDVASANTGPGRWRCRFGDIVVRGRVVSTNRVACPAPAGHGTVKVTVAGPLRDDAFGTSDAAFTFVAAPRVLSLSPIMGWTAGGYVVDVRLSQNVQSCMCRFDDLSVEGTVSDDTVRCRAPPLKEGTTSVRVTCGTGVHELRVRRPAEAFSTQPARGSERGGSLISIKGRNFPNVASLHCVFGGVSVPARWESDGRVTCAAPSRGYPGSVDVTLVSDGLPAHTTTATYTYTQHSVVDSITPGRSSHLGGELVSVRGAFFDASAKLRCAFGGLQVPASLINSTLLKCAAPARPPGLVSLQILVDGLVANAFDFVYELTATAYGIVPTLGPALGGGTISLIGANFDGKTRCCINEVEVATTYVSSTQLRCEAPPRAPATIVRIHVCGDVSKFDYEYFRPALALGASPAMGAEEGGTIVEVKAAFDANDQGIDVMCRFGSTAVNASRLDDVVRCVAPPRRAMDEVVRLAVVYDANEYVEEATSFRYVKNLRITSMSPLNASLRGGSVVRVEGSGFDVNSDVVCSFGGVEVDAIILDASSLGCVAPPFGFATTTWLSVESRFQPAANNRVVFAYVDDAIDPEPPLERLPVVHGASPVIFGSYSRASIRITGEHFLPETLCRFGDQDVDATYVSDTVLLCEAPPRIPSDVELRVSVDSIHWSHTSVRLTYARDASIIDFAPSSGPLRGGTRVMITGRHFHGPATCVFGEIEVYASIRSDTELVCVAPAVARPMKAALSVEMGGVAVHAPSPFAYDYPPEIESIAPPSGPSGTRVILRGRRFGDRIWCRFGSSETRGAVLTRSRAYCVTPPHTSGDVSLEISLNGNDYYGTHARFTYEPDLLITSVWPEMAMGTLGGTTLTVRGTGFRETLGLSCDLDGTRSRAEVVSPTSIVCMAPPHKAGLVSLRVSLHGNDHVSNTLQVLYVDEPRVIEVFPDRGLATGGYALFVEGTNFWNTSSIKCDLDGYKVKGRFVNPRIIVCKAPSFETLTSSRSRRHVPTTAFSRRELRTGDPSEDSELFEFGSKLPYVARVRITINGLDYGTTSGLFEYYDDDLPWGHYVQDDHVQPCPPGTYCPQGRNTNFTLCAPGTFQPRQAQRSCVDCPIGARCPDHGMRWFRKCPAGFACVSWGTKEATTLCPAGHYCREGVLTTNPRLYDNDTRWRRDNETGVVVASPQMSAWVLQQRQSKAFKVRTQTPFSWNESGTQGYRPPSSFSESPYSSQQVVYAPVPFPCPIGHYCKQGASSHIPIPSNFSTPQRCYDGYFCPAGSATPEGSGACPTGHFCPTPVMAARCPRGHHCPGVANVFPRECAPGTFNGLEGMSNCTLCPTGHVCPGWSRTQPERCPAGYVCNALGQSQPVLTCPEGYFCGEGTLTLDPADPTPLRPQPCPPGTFCLGGVAHNLTTPWIPVEPSGVSAPQRCTEGTFCREGSPTAIGSQTCYAGHYCPPGSTYPVQAPLGSFSDVEGAVAPTTCFPGTYAALTAAHACVVCPAGYSCQGYGTYEPKICEAGTYRSLADSVTCRLCPPGTYSTVNGSTDISSCLPCPEGRVCGDQGMFNLTASDRCPEGHSCGVGTERGTMFRHKCPGGTYCGWETLPQYQYELPCLEGFYCQRGTTAQMRQRDRCRVGYYCPPATAAASHPETRCPYFTTSTAAVGQSHIYDCLIDVQHVCDKKLASEFDPFDEQRYYRELTYSILDGSGEQTTVGGTGEGEVTVVAKVMPVNISALQPNYTAPNYVNDTVEVFRTCPEYIDQRGGQDITVIGRNFFDTDLLQCKFTACRSNSSVATHREEPQICAVPNQHTDSEGTPSATRCGDTFVRENSEEIQAIWEKLPSAKDKDNNWVWPRTNQGASSPRCPDGRTAEQGEGQVSGEDQPTGPGHARRQCSEKEQFLMFGDKDVECDLLPGVSPNAFGGEPRPYTTSETGRRYVPQKYSWIENNWVDGGNPLRVVADRSIVVEATYVSKTRLTCKAPSFDFPTHEEVAHKFRTSCLFDRFRPGPWPLKAPIDANGDECRGPVDDWHPTCKAEYPSGNPTSGSRTSASGMEWLGPDEGGNLASAPGEGVRVVKNDPFPNPQQLENPELFCEEGQVCWDPSPAFEGNGLAYLQACAEPSQDCRVFCADQSATFTTLCKLGERGEVNNHCMQIPCPDLLKTQPEAKYGFRLVHDLVFAVTANELAQENKYKELLRGPDHQERTINSNYNRWNPCVTAEVSVDVTNDGTHWSSDLTSAYALLVEPTEKYINQKTHPQKHFVPGTWAVLTYVRQDRWVADQGSLDMDIKRCSHFLVREEGNHTREEGWYLLRGLESAMLSFDFRHLPNELIYDEHYRLAIFVRPSRCVEEECDAARNFLGPKERYPCRQPIHLSNWFQDSKTPKNVLFNMTLIALDDVIFKIEVHVLNGMWLPAVDFFRNSATVQITSPKRARHLDEYTQNVLEEETRYDDVDWLTLMMIYSGTGSFFNLNDKDKNNRPGPDAAELYKTPVKDKLRRKLSPYVSFEERDTDLFHMIGIFYNDDTQWHHSMPPLNMPPTYKDYERGRVLVAFNSTWESQQTVPSVAEPEPSLLVEPAWFEATHTDFDLYEQGCEGMVGECTGLYEQAMDPTMYIDVSKIADANRDVYFETFFMAGILSSQSYLQMKTLSAALEQSEEIMQWINVISARPISVPYLPYFSNCREWDSYVVFHNLVESDRCELPPETTREGAFSDPTAPKLTPLRRYAYPPLPHYDDVQAVKFLDIALGFDKVPLADWCERRVTCSYEEVTTGGYLPLWFNQPDGAMLFQFLKQPISYHQYTGRKRERIGVNDRMQWEDLGGGTVFLVRAQDMDNIINVEVASEFPGGLGYSYFPSAFVLEIGYKQVTMARWKYKEIIFAVLHVQEMQNERRNEDGSPVGPPDYEYTLDVSYHPLDYIELIVWFAFEEKVFLIIFFIAGFLTILISVILWTSVRLTTMLENPPRVRIWSTLLLIIVPPFQGVLLGFIPIFVAQMSMSLLIKPIMAEDALFAFIPGYPVRYVVKNIPMEMVVAGIFHNIFGSGSLIGLYIMQTDANNAVMGLQPVEWQDPVIDEPKLRAARSGRLGFTFVVIAMRCWQAACQMFLPNRTTQRELDIQKRRDPAAEKEDIWNPNAWKRSNLIFTSFTMGLFCCVVAEFSYWQYFGTYIWFVIIGLRPLGQFLCAIVEEQLQEALLVMPVMTAFDMTCGVITLSCDDFVDFMGGYFIELGMGLCEQVYFDPALVDIIDGAFYYWNELKAKTLKLLPKWIIGSSAEQAAEKSEEQKTAKRDLEGAVAEGGETVEPILDAFGAYSTCAMFTVYNVFVLLILIGFREEVQMTKLYNIKNNDMLYFLLFSVVLIPFQFIADVFTLSVLELFHGWKIYDYLIYTRYRFLQRETRWKGLEDSLDECIDESVRTLDQMCFSSQYYMMMTVQVNGIMMFIFGMQMMVQAQYNVFGDQMMPFIYMMTINNCQIINAIIMKLAIYMKLWRVKHENTAWHTALQESDEFEVPGWEDLKGGSHDAFMMNQRITSETFRFKFLNYNRAWLINQLPSILTPRTLRRSRPYLINQFTRILNQLNQDISSDSEDDGRKFGPVALKANSRQIIRWWLAQARRRMRLREVVQPLISKARGTQCENCLSRRQLQVTCVIPLEVLAAQFDAENADQEFDQVAWKTFWIKSQRYRTICMACVAKQRDEERAGGVKQQEELSDDEPDGPQWGPVFLSPAARAILIGWHRRAAERLFGKGGKRRQAAAAELSDDDDAPEFGRRFGEVALDAASRAIAVYWLRSARANLQNQGDAGKPAVKRKRPKKGEGREAKSRKAKK